MEFVFMHLVYLLGWEEAFVLLCCSCVFTSTPRLQTLGQRIHTFISFIFSELARQQEMGALIIVIQRWIVFLNVSFFLSLSLPF